MAPGGVHESNTGFTPPARVLRSSGRLINPFMVQCCARTEEQEIRKRHHQIEKTLG